MHKINPSLIMWQVMRMHLGFVSFQIAFLLLLVAIFKSDAFMPFGNVARYATLPSIHHHATSSSCAKRIYTGYHVPTSRKLSMTTSVTSKSAAHSEFIKKYASIDVPKRLDTLISLLELKGETILSPSERKGLNPFLIPLSKSKDGSILAYIRWPTQKVDMDLQLVRTTETGIRLVAMGSTSFCRRIVAEMDFYSMPECDKAIELVNKEGPLYERGEFLGLLRSGKFPAITEEDLALILDRFLLTKVGPFPDCYERIAENFLKKNDIVSALVTCERGVTIFYGWGHPLRFYSEMLQRIPGRELEARDTARTSLGMPIWTVSNTKKELEALALAAGFTGTAILGEMHAYRSNDPRTDDIGEGLSPLQVTLDQAAHLMDAMAFDHVVGGWEGSLDIIADKYEKGGYPEMANFIRA